jgi:hypothetical protein
MEFSLKTAEILCYALLDDQEVAESGCFLLDLSLRSLRYFLASFAIRRVSATKYAMNLNKGNSVASEIPSLED